MDDLLVEGGVIRKLWVSEFDQYLAHLLRLDDESRRNRFGGAVSDEVIRAYVERADGLGTIVHGFLVDATLRGVAEIRLLGTPFADSGEAAFSIDKPWQSHLQLICLSDNRRMQQLARKFDAELSFDFGSVIGDVETPFPTPLSMFRELVSDGRMVASAMLDAQMRLLR